MSVKEVISYSYHVRSSQRNAGTATDLVIQLKDILTLQSKNGIFQIIIKNSQIPYSFYEMTSDINTFQCKFTDSGGNFKISNISIAVGNYNAISILDELKSKLIAEASISSGLYVGFTPTLSFTYDTTLAKAVLSMSAPANSQIEIYFSLNTIGGSFFGFGNNAVISPTLTATSDKVLITNPVSYLLLRCSTLRQLKNREWIVEKDVFSDIVYKIPIYTGQNTWLQYDVEGTPIYILNDNISTINFYLTNNLTYTPIDLQGLEWSFSFVIREVEKPAYEQKTLAINILPQIPTGRQTEEEIKTSRFALSEEEPPIDSPEVQEITKKVQEELGRLDKYSKKLQKYKSKNNSRDKEENVLQE